MARLFALAICIFITGCAPPSPLPDMQPGEQGRVVKIIDGDALVLESGQSVRLVSVLAPVLYPRDRPPDRYAGESARALEDLALGRRVQLFYPGLTRDRYDRALADSQTLDAETWQDTRLGFRRVEARLVERQISTSTERYAPACLWTLEGSKLALRVTKDAAAVCGLTAGTKISVSGWISLDAIERNHPWHWQLL